MSTYIQIGTNDGNDDFTKYCLNNAPSKIILVEPNSGLNDRIINNYNNINNYIIENYAITETDDSDIKLVIPKNNNCGVSVNGVKYGDKGFSILPMTDWGTDFLELSTKTITFNSLCEKHNIYNIRYLQIDTEGYDATIINSIDFENINIDIIKFEYWGFGENAYINYDNKELLGKNGMDYICDLLSNKGYIIEKHKDSQGDTNFIAYKNGEDRNNILNGIFN